MKKSKIIVSAILIGILTFSMSGCGSADNAPAPNASEGSDPETTEIEEITETPETPHVSRLTAEAVAEYAEEQNAEVYEDQDAILNRFTIDKHNSGVEQIDGRITLADKQLEDFFNNDKIPNAFSVTMDYDPDMTQASYYFVDGWLDFGAWFFESLSIDFESPREAAAYAEGIQNQINESFQAYDDNDEIEYGMSEGSEDGIRRFTAVGVQKWITLHENVYTDGNSVLLLIMYQNNTELGGETQAAFCERFDIYHSAIDQKAIADRIEEELDSQVQAYTGNTQAYIIDPYNPEKNTDNGYDGVVYKYMDEDPPVFIKYEVLDVYKPSVVYVYLDGVELKIDEVSKRTWGYRGSLYLREDQQIADGAHTLEFIQYIDDDPAGEQRFYKSIEFTIVDKTDND